MSEGAKLEAYPRGDSCLMCLIACTRDRTPHGYALKVRLTCHRPSLGRENLQMRLHQL